MKILCLALPFILSLTAFAQVSGERIWTGANGKNFRGTFHRLAPDKKTADFLSTEGKLITVSIDNLSAPDRELLLNPTRAPKTAPASLPEDPAPAGEKSSVGQMLPAPEGFSAIRQPHRQISKLMVPKSYGGTNSGDLVDAAANAIAWWDQSNVLAIPSRGDDFDKIRWVRKRLDGMMKGGKNPDANDLKLGIEKYFASELKDIATCRVTLETKDFSVKRMAEMAKGADAIILEMSMTYGNGRDFSVNTHLETITEDGEFSMILHGKRLFGILKPPVKKGLPESDGPTLEFVISNPTELVDFHIENEARFHIGARIWNTIIAVRPYIYAEEGKPVPLPPLEASN